MSKYLDIVSWILVSEPVSVKAMGSALKISFLTFVLLETSNGESVENRSRTLRLPRTNLNFAFHTASISSSLYTSVIVSKADAK